MQARTPSAVISKCFRAAAVLCLAWLCASLNVEGQDATPLRVQILNGKTGRPLANQKIVLMTHAGAPSQADQRLASEVTDGEGYALLPNISDPSADVVVFVETHQPCSKNFRHNFSPMKVRVAGVVSENSCKPRITMYPQPGTLIFYVRDQTFLEKMRS
jgi:hypothetical protein